MLVTHVVQYRKKQIVRSKVPSDLKHDTTPGRSALTSCKTIKETQGVRGQRPGAKQHVSHMWCNIPTSMRL